MFMLFAGIGLLGSLTERRVGDVRRLIDRLIHRLIHRLKPRRPATSSPVTSTQK